MANFIDVTIRTCLCEGRICTTTVTVDDVNSELFVGGIFSFSAITTGDVKPILPFGCYEVMSLKESGKQEANTVFVNLYQNCEECLTDISNALRFENCFDSKFSVVYLPKTSFSPLPTVNDVFFLDVYIDNKDGGFVRVTSCFTFVGLVIINPNALTNYGLISSTPYSDCEVCSSESPIIYLVQECLSSNYYNIALPSNLYKDHLITFTGLDGITQYCGIVQEIINEATTGLFVADLGLYDKETNNCDDCLANVAEKKKLVNCLDSEDILIAWASQLFEAGDVTNISINNSCYIISPDPVDPEEPITVPEFADFDPHAGCENCFECHGITLDFSSCTEVTVCGELSKYTFGSYSGGYSLVIDGNNAFISFNSGEIIKFDLTTNSVLNNYGGPGILPGKMSIDPTNKILAVPDRNSNQTKFVNVNTNVQAFTSTGPAQRHLSSYFNPSNNLTYVGVWNLTGNSFVQIYDATTFPIVTYVNTISLPAGFSKINITSTAGKIFIAGDSTIYVYDEVTYTLLNSIGLPFNVTSITYSPTLNKIFVVGGSNSLFYIDPNTYGVIGLTGVFPACCGDKTIFYNNVNFKLYVSDTSANQVYQINESTLTIEQTFNIESSNQPYEMGVYGGNIYAITNTSLVELGCDSAFLNNSINSYEYVPVGHSFYHPIYDICCTVTNIRTDMDGEYDFYSLKSYSGGCSSCDAVSYDIFTATGCDVPINSLVVAESGQYSIGDIVRSHWGNSDFLCFELDGVFSPGEVNLAFDYIFETENQPSFSSCAECKLGATVGITLINCNTLVESYVNVSLDTWQNIFGLIGLSTPCMSDNDENCYTVVNSCPIDNIYEEFTPTNFYFDCTFCKADNPGKVPRSANTENLVCVTCCPCDGSSGSTFSVTPPHPVWTDGYGVSVTQMNMITLGGINGLNG